MATYQVFLNVYDVTNSGNESQNAAIVKINNITKDLGIGGIFHGAVEIDGYEWSFGYCDRGTGIYCCHARKNPMYMYRETVDLGPSPKSKQEIKLILHKLKQEWPGPSYELLARNCCHFCEVFCKELEVKPPPAWLNRFATGADATVKVTNEVVKTAKLVGSSLHKGAAVSYNWLKDAVSSWVAEGKKDNSHHRPHMTRSANIRGPVNFPSLPALAVRASSWTNLTRSQEDDLFGRGEGDDGSLYSGAREGAQHLTPISDSPKSSFLFGLVRQQQPVMVENCALTSTSEAPEAPFQPPSMQVISNGAPGGAAGSAAPSEAGPRTSQGGQSSQGPQGPPSHRNSSSGASAGPSTSGGGAPAARASPPAGGDSAVPNYARPGLRDPTAFSLHAAAQPRPRPSRQREVGGQQSPWWSGHSIMVPSSALAAERQQLQQVVGERQCGDDADGALPLGASVVEGMTDKKTDQVHILDL